MSNKTDSLFSLLKDIVVPFLPLAIAGALIISLYGKCVEHCGSETPAILLSIALLATTFVTTIVSPFNKK